MSKRRRSSDESDVATVTVPYQRTECRQCGSENSTVLRTDRLHGVPYFNPRTDTTYPNQIRRRHKCNDCGCIFTSGEGFGGNGAAH